MDNFKRGNKFSGGNKGRKFGGKSFGGDRGGKRSFGGGRGGERSEMFSTVCSDCGKNCEVPFRPTGEKPVFCSDCFRNRGENNSRDSRGGDRGFGGRDFKPRLEDKNRGLPNYKAQFESLNIKLDKILKLLTPVTEETFVVGFSKPKKVEKLPKKEVSVVALKKAIKKTVEKKPVVKKKVTKKKVVKKKK